MDKPLFSIHCTTCQARLAVRDEAAIGTILLCPKCQSFVHVLAPPGWRSASESPHAPAGPAPPAQPAPQEQRAAASAIPAAQGPKTGAAGRSAPGPQPAESPKAPADPALADTVEDFPELMRPVSERSERAKAVARAVPPPLPLLRPPSQAPATMPPAEAHAGAAPSETLGGAAAASTPACAEMLLPAQSLVRKWLVLALAPVAGLLLAAVLVGVFARGGGPTELPEETAESPSDAAPPDAPKSPEGPLLPDRLDPRWIPDEARVVVVLRLARLGAQPEFSRAADAVPPEYRKAVQSLLDHLRLTPDAVYRLTWSAADLNDWAGRAVVAIELADGQDVAPLAGRGRESDVRLAGVACRHEPGAAWPHPFAAVHRRLVVTGDADLLRRLAGRGEPRLESKPLERILQGVAPELDAALLVDLGAARVAGWKLPVALLDVWPAGRRPWRVVWEVPQGLGLALRLDDQVRSEVALVCEAETAADEVRAALEELLPASQAALGAQIASLADRVKAGQLKAEAANHYEDLLGQAQAGLRAARVETADSAVWMRVHWPRSFDDLVRAGLAGRASARDDWLAAALALDEENQRRLLGALGAHAKAEGTFPAGAAGAGLLSPDTRLSWIALLLPYLGHRDWHSQLQLAYPWNGPQNNKITRRLLEEVVNPALGPGATPAGFPVTHYVGVAGVGEDAAGLKADDPRAGVFGFGRATRPEEISDGASNTIALAGVSADLGAWGSGGRPTVRAFTRRPYVNGPDGFGSGQLGGMLVGMADGSVRFISKDVDPRVLELLATARGGEAVDLAALDVRPALRKPDAQGPAAKVPQKPDPAAKAPAVPEKPDPVAKPQPAETVKIDVRARLDDKLAAIELSGVPLGKAIELLESFSTLRITLDLDEMEQLGVTLQDPVKVKLAGTTVGQVLEAALAQHGLVHVVEGSNVLVTRPARLREALRTVRYNVSDLAGGEEQDEDALDRLLQRLVAPESWKDSGGRGKVEALEDVLVVEQTDAVHHETLEFFEKLRVARGLPTRSRTDRRAFRLDTRRDRAAAVLGRPVTANFIAPTPLPEIIAYLEEIGETTIVVDWIALGAEHVPPGIAGTLRADNQPLGAALTSLLEPLGLAWRVAAGDVLQVTTAAAARARRDLEFYPVDPLLEKDAAAEALIRTVKDQVARGRWDDARGPGVIRFDAPSKCLLVLQSQPVQAEVQALLERLKAEKGAGDPK